MRRLDFQVLLIVIGLSTFLVTATSGLVLGCEIPRPSSIEIVNAYGDIRSEIVIGGQQFDRNELSKRFYREATKAIEETNHGGFPSCCSNVLIEPFCVLARYKRKSVKSPELVAIIPSTEIEARSLILADTLYGRGAYLEAMTRQEEPSGPTPFFEIVKAGSKLAAANNDEAFQKLIKLLGHSEASYAEGLAEYLSKTIFRNPTILVNNFDNIKTENGLKTLIDATPASRMKAIRQNYTSKCERTHELRVCEVARALK